MGKRVLFFGPYLAGPFTLAATNRLTGFREFVHKSKVNVNYDLFMADGAKPRATASPRIT